MTSIDRIAEAIYMHAVQDASVSFDALSEQAKMPFRALAHEIVDNTQFKLCPKPEK